MRYFPLLISFLCFSCAKEKSCEKCQDESTYKNAIIVFQGPVETDGCGWLVKIDDTHTYHPDVLDIAFQQDQLQVNISYELTSQKFICGIGGLQITVIHVKDIKL